METNEIKEETPELKEIDVNGKKVICELINDIYFPRDIPVKLWSELSNPDIDLSIRLWRIHKLAFPESKLTVADIEAKFWVRELIEVLAHYKLSK